MRAGSEPDNHGSAPARTATASTETVPKATGRTAAWRWLGGALAFVQWGSWSPFKPGEAGFTGELELLLVGVGLLFLLVGGGGWSVDRGFRSRKTAD